MKRWPFFLILSVMILLLAGCYPYPPGPPKEHPGASPHCWSVVNEQGGVVESHCMR